MVGSFATENLKGEKEKGLGVHVPSLCQNIAWLMCTAMVQLPSAVLFPGFLAAYFQGLHELYSLSVQPIRVIVAIISVISHRNNMLTDTAFSLLQSHYCAIRILAQRFCCNI